MKDNSWIKFGEEDPYFGVVTDPKFKGRNLAEEVLTDFFRTGEEHVAEVLQQFRSFFKDFNEQNIRRVLDFGCGTGRLVIPFAQRFAAVEGIDISEGMLAEARKNSEARKLSNITLHQSADITTLDFPEPFDLVHTFIVLQHIPVAQGYRIIDKLLSLTRKDGFGFIHFTYANNLSAIANKKLEWKARYRWFHQFSNIIKGARPNAPLMQMNNYSLPRVFEILNQHGLQQVSLGFTDHGGFKGVSVYYRK